MGWLAQESGMKTKILSALTLLATLQMSAGAQSLDFHTPTALKAGPNKATIDSFVQGDHFWYFNSTPGTFQINFSVGSPQEGFSVGNKAEAAASFAPQRPGNSITYKEVPGGMVFQGVCKTPGRVIVMVEAKKSPLVRQTTDYIINVSGSASFGGGDGASAGDGGAATPSVVGTYNFKLNDFGAAKFKADGTVVTTSGDNGTWELFDAATRTYILNIRGVKYNLTFQPGRGFIDGSNNNLLLECKPVM
jgi:hypothetical protein